MAEAVERDIDSRGVLYAAVAIAAGIAFALAGSWFLLNVLGPAANAANGAAASAAIPAPRLQPAPQPERAAYFARKQQRLATYGWVDRQGGMVHIPLDEAMALMAAQAAAQSPDRSGARPAGEGRHHE